MVATAVATSVRWDCGQVDLLGCTYPGPQGQVVLALDPAGVLASATAQVRTGGLPVTLEFAEVCPIAVRHRIRARMRLAGRLAAPPVHGPAKLRLDVARVTIEQDGVSHEVGLADYQQAAPDPLHRVAAEHVQHLYAQHPDALDLLARLCGRSALSGATRVVPIGLDHAGLVLRVERLRGHSDIRLSFRSRAATTAELAAQMSQLLTQARRHHCRRA